MDSEIKANEYVTEHFKFSECRCPCCDMLKIIPGFFLHMEWLERMRQELGFAMVINSGYRCLSHNRAVNGRPKSWHLLFATDVRAEDNDERKILLIYRKALEMNWGGIGKHRTFVHLDLRPEEMRWRG